MKTRAELRSSHGTPEEFERAVWEAYGSLMVTNEEAVVAIQKYREEYAAAEEGEWPKHEAPQDQAQDG